MEQNILAIRRHPRDRAPGYSPYPEIWSVTWSNLRVTSQLTRCSPAFANHTHSTLFAVSLIQLPTEVIENILQHADWKSVLRARAVSFVDIEVTSNAYHVTRQSCKRLESISRSLSIWRSQYAALIALNPSTPPLESPLERYSSFELEKIVLQRGSVDAGWHSVMEHPVSMRIIPFENVKPVALHLVKGGRWLLASNIGAVVVCDLENSKDPGRLLVPRHPDAHPRQPITDLKVDVLANASTLTFHLAIGQYHPGMLIDLII